MTDLLPIRCQSCGNYLGDYHEPYRLFQIDYVNSSKLAYSGDEYNPNSANGSKGGNNPKGLSLFFDNLELYVIKAMAKQKNPNYSLADLEAAARERFFPYRKALQTQPNLNFFEFYQSYIAAHGKASDLLPCCEGSFLRVPVVQRNIYFHDVRAKEQEQLERVTTNITNLEQAELLVSSYTDQYQDYLALKTRAVEKVIYRPLNKESRAYFA